MRRLLTIPHRRKLGMCPVNGIRDLVHWRSGRDWSNEFLWGLGQGGGFAYLRFNSADPPRQREAVDAGTPPVLGPLDMFHLHFYDDIYHKRHIPIHFVLLVGYEDENAYVHDTDKEKVQVILLDELRLAWDVNVPGLGKRNRLAIIDVPQELPPTDVLIRRSIADECKTMLHPPVSMVGTPAMKKVAREIARWPEELGEDIALKCLRQVREYLNSPPDLEGHHLTAGTAS